MHVQVPGVPGTWYRRTYLVSQYAVAYPNIHNKSFGKLSFVASEYGAKVNRYG
jgi:hypothetical protein